MSFNIATDSQRSTAGAPPDLYPRDRQQEDYVFHKIQRICEDICKMNGIEYFTIAINENNGSIVILGDDGLAINMIMNNTTRRKIHGLLRDGKLPKQVTIFHNNKTVEVQSFRDYGRANSQGSDSRSQYTFARR